MSFQSAWSTNAVSICASCGLKPVKRLEQSRRFLLRLQRPLTPETLTAFAALVRSLQRATQEAASPSH
jgi:phosphoribosylformylglycinamidine synthase